MSARTHLAGLSATSIALGESHACTIGSGGGIKCWGWNGDGQLGTGGTADQHTPMDVPGAETDLETSTQKCSLSIAGVKSDNLLTKYKWRRTIRRIGVRRLNFAAETLSLKGAGCGRIATAVSATTAHAAGPTACTLHFAWFRGTMCPPCHHIYHLLISRPLLPCLAPSKCPCQVSLSSPSPWGLATRAPSCQRAVSSVGGSTATVSWASEARHGKAAW